MTETTRHAPRPIVAGSDLSDGSDQALQAVADIASAADGELYVFHCVNQRVFPYGEGALGEESRAGWVQSAQIDVEWQIRRVLGDIKPAGLAVTIGEPAREIADYASRIVANLLVVGE